MKIKAIGIFSVLLCIVLLLSACVPTNVNRPDSNNPEGSKTSPSSDPVRSSGSYSTQSALSEFTTDYMDSMKPFEESLSEDYNAQAMSITGTMALLNLPFYDLMDLFGTGSASSDKDGVKSYRKVENNVVKFGSESTAKEDSYSMSKGDVSVDVGELDLNTNSLKYEFYILKNGVKTEQRVYEIIRLSDGTFATQFVDATKPINPNQSPYIRYTFFKISKNKFEALSGRIDDASNFNYTSIIGMKSIDIEQLASGITLTAGFTATTSSLDYKTY